MTPQPPKFKTRYNHAPSSERDLCCKLPTLTKSDFKEDADIKVLFNRYREKGYFYNPLTTHMQKPRLPQFGDFTKLPDLHTAIKTVETATELFSKLPAEIREAVGHSPAVLVQNLKNPAIKELFKKYKMLPDPSGVQGIKSPATAVNIVPDPKPVEPPASAPNPEPSE